ncbi:FAD-binding monooxygenase [Kocuria sp.]|uniref:FAD-binding monooxygenase n=1 Tax=Kocuria sp. TaxID=1871328 RepID=UPI0026DEE086|nr:FAD-binding monooxygenase [Kocuria sp.]MDO5619780.1 FAD-binding monooxygenase [Kocuria sp.]
MQFHHHGYVSTDPRIESARGHGVDRPTELPEVMDVLIVGTGPAGMMTAAQLSQFPGVNTRIIEKRPHRLEIGQADGIQARSVETFQAFGFANRLIDEAYHITEMNFWKPDPAKPEHIRRAARTLDDPNGVSEFPHLIVNQARILDYFAEFALLSPGRVQPDYGIEFVDLTVHDSGEHPVEVTVRHTAGPRQGQERTVRAKYVVGSDGARSGVRSSIGRKLSGDQANHAWGVMDVLAVTDFPDIRTKCAIQSQSGGSILLIPREGGHLFRMYVDLGEVPLEGSAAVRATTIEQIVERANQIMAPYTVDVKNVAWKSVYEVGHRLTDAFDDAGDAGTDADPRTPRVFITGDACHTHSAKAGQGMNVSMQDGWNLAWKLGHVVEGRSPAALLRTYSGERQVIAKNLIDFDKEWSTLMATKPEDLEDPSYLEDFYVKTAEFPAGFMTEYQPSMITGSTEHQGLATGFPVGKRFKSARVSRLSDGNPLHLGHQAVADGRWRIYVFADAAQVPLSAGDTTVDVANPAAPEGSMTGADTAPPATQAPDPASRDLTSAAPAAHALGEWLATSPDSPVVAHTAGFGGDADDDALFDIRVVYPGSHHDVDIIQVPEIFKPKVGPFGLRTWEKVYAEHPEESIFAARGIGTEGAVVVVRPDQYVAAVLPLTDHKALTEFFRPIFTSL